jgi:ribonuclease P protein component
LRGSFLRLHFAPGAAGRPRLGITASRKVGNAVVRNRLKRRVREIFRRWPVRPELPALDLVVHLEPAAAKASFSQLAAELEDLLGRLVARGRR